MRQAEGGRNSPDKFSLDFPKHSVLSLCLNSFLSLLLPYLPFSPEKNAVFHLNSIIGKLAGPTECLLRASLKASPQKPWSDSRQVVESCREVSNRKKKGSKLDLSLKFLESKEECG